MLPRRRHEISEPVEELKRREFDDAVGPRPRGLAATAGPNPADHSGAAVCLQREKPDKASITEKMSYSYSWPRLAPTSRTAFENFTALFIDGIEMQD